ncbi:MAG TPA: hypothetical protein VD866_17690 [Urbifossiella sp.]|nr:hypothetical protein [Urbifossiella sp.]
MTQRKRRKVRMLGIVQRRGRGRPEYVYGRRCKLRELEHEVRVTDVALMYRDLWTFTRDEEVGEGKTKTIPDAGMTNGRKRAWLEVDNLGKQSRKQYAVKWAAYSCVGDFVLVVCTSEKRMQQVRSWCPAALHDRVLLTTFDRLASDAAEPWIDCAGEPAEL